MHYVAVSVKRNSTTGGHMFIDGAQVLQFDPTGLFGQPHALPAFNHSASAIIAESDYVSFFKGRIDEVSVYRRALSASEIKAI